ncbi:hypothetical protein [Egbenema bharatensis]|uniref:hypothetical protein n=1 Tax=Egbenema bharatensis TaxID=3463334 RepID=UPI003A8986EF
MKSDSSSQASATYSPHQTRNQQAVLDVLHRQPASKYDILSFYRAESAVYPFKAMLIQKQFN